MIACDVCAVQVGEFSWDKLIGNADGLASTVRDVLEPDHSPAAVTATLSQEQWEKVAHCVCNTTL